MNSGTSANHYQPSLIYGRPPVGYEQQVYDVAGRNGGSNHHPPQYINYTHRGGSMPGSIPGSIPGTVSIPQTPFDPVYGITLLPSHLLVGSPFVNTPQTGGPMSAGTGANGVPVGSNNIMNLRNSSYKSFYPPAPKLRPAPSGRLRRARRKDNKPQQQREHSRDNNKVEAEYDVERGYSSRSASRSQSFSASTSGSMSGSSGPKSIRKTIDSELKIQFQYSILPKGNDTYRSRSLLFTNVNSELDIVEFLQKVAKNYPIESIYLIKDEDTGDDIENLNTSNNDDDPNQNYNADNNNNSKREDDKNKESAPALTKQIAISPSSCSQQSYLLSFFTKESCLDFYNNLLQRYAEIKNAVKSDQLAMNFVKIQDDEEWMANLKMNVISLGATRSLYVEFADDSVTSDTIWDTLPFLKNSGKYVVIDVDVVTTDERRKNFGLHYCLLHFLSVTMALEVKELLETGDEAVSRVSFVTPANSADKEMRRRRSSAISLKQEASPQMFSTDSRSRSRSSNVSLPLSEQVSTASTDISTPIYEEFDGNLTWSTLIVDVSEYKEPIVNEFDHHLNSWSISKPTTLYMHESGTTNFSSSNLSDDIDPLSISSHDPVPQQMLLNEYPYIMEPLMPPQITQTIQNQYSKSIQAVNAGMEHRTVYIGNINPRSKAEDICNVVRGGILQHIKWVSHKRICFVTFIETAAAVQFYANTTLEPIILHGNVLKVGWGQNPGPLPKNIALAVTVGASRNVYVSLPDKAFKDKFINDPQFKEYQNRYKIPNIAQLKSDFGAYGTMEQVNFHSDGHCCWINFMNISSAIKLVEEYSDTKDNLFHKKTEGRYVGLIIGYGKDRCGNINRNLVFNKNGKGSNHNRNSQNNNTSRGHRQRKQSATFSNASNIDLKHSSVANASIANGKLDRPMDNKNFLSLGVDADFSEGLGISISPQAERRHVLSDNEDEREEHREEEQEECGNRHSGVNGSNVANNEAINETLINGTYTADIPEDTLQVGSDSCSTYSGSSSSDVDIIVNAPSPKAGDAKSFTHTRRNAHHRQRNTNQTRQYNNHHHAQQHQFQPLSHINAPYQTPQPQYHPYPQTPHRFSNSFVPVAQHEGANNGNPRKSSMKPIAGSDVMTRYLEQLHHNTFVYAANILGATQDPVFYDEDNA